MMSKQSTPVKEPGIFNKLWLRVSSGIEYWILTRLTKNGVGPVMRWVFRIPIYCYRIGLGSLIGGRLLLLSTCGRKTGRWHTTALEFGYYPQNDVFDVMAGWGGKTDWYRNALLNPDVFVWVGKRKFIGRAENTPVMYVVDVMKGIMDFNRRAADMWGMLNGVTIDGTDESWQANATYFPMLILHPVKDVSDFPL